jgi:two-component system, sensor histidine kinase
MQSDSAISSRQGASESAGAQASGERRRILIIEDSADDAFVMQMKLELTGDKVQTALDGLSGLEAARTFKPEVILIDIGLPDIAGYEVARRLRAEPATKDALLIAHSGYGGAEDLRKSKEAGFDHHLVKATDTNRLQALISGYSSAD